MILAAKSSQGWFPRRPTPVAAKYLIEFVQVEVHQEDAVGGTVFNRLGALVVDPAFVDAALHDSSLAEFGRGGDFKIVRDRRACRLLALFVGRVKQPANR
jgi:hypothetical protein